ncbi:MAG: Helix-hairpin-helix DNA-binding class 1 [Gemmatimonadetes bacterium]|nr:Helix-hairpin-helix DNA-binding class 1 [Gemmatimonadota bacterium]
MPPEHRAVLLLLGLGLVGHVVRLVVSDARRPPGEVRLLGSSDSSAALARRDSLVRLARPLARGERIDADRASAQELQRLPGVGPGLARRIVEERNRSGPFGDTAALRRVPGIGPSKLRRMAPNLAFSAVSRAPMGVSPPVTPVVTAPAPVYSEVINLGSIADLERISGIGRRRAARIVAFRDSAGPFRTPSDLARVLGISLALARALWTAAGQQ